MGLILASGNYPDIRAKLGVTTDDLPDADITTIGLLSTAEALIIKVVPNYASLTGSDLVFLQSATLSLCGALAVSKLQMQRGQSFQMGQYQESATRMTWDELRETLAQETKMYLLLISTNTPTTRPKVFLRSGPTSQGTTWPVTIDRWYARIRPHFSTWLQTGGQILQGWENNP